ncbi:juxtaposed with another zinc finger protein 1 isoform X1 [Neodiprion virginianus]|uniref:juxtaposed with another zinc finger protein 1 isoform X1 n=1 Tax=Neodiprion virginianus TaxID=2961670 RepID=UPI001EE7262A|nr:juxtaposed with another zinc finger protein 1 isoform X1 [Neodiprion virginianus]
MAVFMLNICKFNGCGLTFKSLGDLIQHIEETHIDYDPRVVEQTEQQQPTCIPLSYVLRFLTDAARKEGVKPVHQSRSNQTCLPSSTRNKNNTPTGSEAEEGEDFVSEPEDSNDSWTTSLEFSADFILRYGSRAVSQNTANQNNNTDKPFACPIPGCKKRYKNINGIKYHSKNGHKNDNKVRKAFKCPCGKSYKTSYGLKNHAAIQHSGSLLQVKILQNNKMVIKLESDYDSSTSSISDRHSLHLTKPSKCKVPAIEDHGYIKQEQSVVSETDCKGVLGILTPASSPPLPVHTSIRAKPVIHPVHNVQKYLANLSSSQINYPNITVTANEY